MRADSWKIPLFVFALTWLLMSGSYTLMFPFLPVYLLNDLHCPEEDLTFWSSACFSIQFVFSALLSPFWGRIADRYGRKLMLLRASSMLAIAYFLCLIVQSPLQLFFARAFMGFACGITPVILAMSSDTVPKNRLGLAMGIFQSMNVLGTVVGPLCGGLIAQYLSVRYSFVITTCDLSLVTLLNLIFIHEPKRSEKKTAAINENHVSVMAIMKSKEKLTVLGIVFLIFMILMLPVAFLTPYIAKLSGSAEHGVALSGVVFSLTGIAGAIAAPLWGMTGQRRGFFRCMIAAMLCSCVFMVLQSAASDLLPFAVLQFLSGLCVAGIVPMVNALLVQVTDPKERGTAFGLMYSCQEAGQGSGPMVGGLISSLLGTRSVFACGGIMLCTVGVLLLFKAPLRLRHHKATDQA